MKPTKEILKIKERFKELDQGYETPELTENVFVDLCAQSLIALSKYYHARQKALASKDESFNTILCETEYFIEKLMEFSRMKEEKIFVEEMISTVENKIKLDTVDESQVQ